jgi:hypothetical protein
VGGGNSLSDHNSADSAKAAHVAAKLPVFAAHLSSAAVALARAVAVYVHASRVASRTGSHAATVKFVGRTIA